MTTKLTQALLDRAATEHASGTPLYGDDVSGLRVVIGNRACSWKLVGRINDQTDR